MALTREHPSLSLDGEWGCGLPQGGAWAKPQQVTQGLLKTAGHRSSSTLPLGAAGSFLEHGCLLIHLRSLPDWLCPHGHHAGMQWPEGTSVPQLHPVACKILQGSLHLKGGFRVDLLAWP